MNPRDPAASDPLREALRSLPRESASADFTSRLVERARTAPHRRRPVPRRRPSRWRPIAAAAGVILAVAAGAWLRERQEARDTAARRIALELRHEELRRELAALRREVTDPPTLYLGATSDYDVVMDLGPWLEQGSVRPAAYERPDG